jgi:predicted alpha-1,6-mannanase (GH76 family)
MAVDEAPAKDETAEPLITRVVRAVTQPGGMDIDWTKVSAAGAVIAGLSVIHGLRHHRWRYTHTFGVMLGIGAAAAARLKAKYVVTARPPESK